MPEAGTQTGSAWLGIRHPRLARNGTDRSGGSEHHEVSGLGGFGGFDCSCSRASFQENHQYHAHRRRAFLWKPKWPCIRTKPPKPAKPPQPSTTVRAGCNARFLLREVHVSGALSGACTGKGPQMANPRPTPKPENLGPPWPVPAPGQPCRLFPRPPPSGAQDDRWFVRDPLGLTPPGYELAPHTGLDKAPPERGMKADSMPERLLIGPGSPPSIDPVYPELSPPPEPCLAGLSKNPENVPKRTQLGPSQAGKHCTRLARGNPRARDGPRRPTQCPSQPGPAMSSGRMGGP